MTNHDAEFGSDWQEVIFTIGDLTHEAAICPACHAYVAKDVWTGGNTLREHYERLHASKLKIAHHAYAVCRPCPEPPPLGVPRETLCRICWPREPILPESTTEGATTFPPRGADDAPDESKGAVPNAPAPASSSELAYLRERWWAVRDLLLRWDREQEVIKNILAAVTDQPRVDAMALAQMAMVDELRAIVETKP